MRQFYTMRSFIDKDSLEGKLLVATPTVDGTIFDKSLIFICAHDKEGAVGVMINKPVFAITREELMKKTGIVATKRLDKKFTVFCGGPIEENNLMVLTATPEQKKNFKTKQVLTLYSNAERYLQDILAGELNDDFLICKGFCSWAPGQLDEEVKDNSWILMVPDFKTIFAGQPAKKWKQAIKKAGIKDIQSLHSLVSYSGHA